jgi:hypothetical protein
MTFTNKSNVNKLSTPLLGKRLLQQENHKELQGCIPSCSSRTLAIVYVDEEEESCQKAAEDESQRTNNLGVVSVVLPALLFMQFGMVFSMNPVQATTTGLKWSLTNYTIVMFIVNAAFYRQTIQDFQLTCLVARLLPEIIIGTVLGLVFCDQVVPAFFLLLSSMLCMGVIVSVHCIYYLVVINSEAASPEKKYDEESFHEEFGVGFEPLWPV